MTLPVENRSVAAQASTALANPALFNGSRLFPARRPAPPAQIASYDPGGLGLRLPIVRRRQIRLAPPRPLGLRRLFGVSYRCRHQKGLVELLRIVRLRRRLHADPTPFSPLPAKQRNSRKHLALCREIRQLEEQLVEHLRVNVGNVLERRYDRSFRRLRRKPAQGDFR
jgi:hypothetical protein